MFTLVDPYQCLLETRLNVEKQMVTVLQGELGKA